MRKYTIGGHVVPFIWLVQERIDLIQDEVITFKRSWFPLLQASLHKSF
jgi:hypothetical protein